MKRIERLRDLMWAIPDAYNKQIIQVFDGISDARYVDCEMYSWQDEPKEPHKIENGYVYWSVYYSIGFGTNFVNADDCDRKTGFVGIPKWLYEWYLQGKAKYISWQQVQML